MIESTHFPKTLGIVPIRAKNILTPTKGFLSDYTHTINPYSGCSFGCSYCYVPNGFELAYGKWGKENWGEWVYPKSNASSLLYSSLSRLSKQGKIGNSYIYLGSVTDPYQPAEKSYQITKSILETILSFPVGYLNIQTRSPLVLRDLPLLQRVNRVLNGRLSVCVTLTTNREEERQRFEFRSPSLKSRRLALQRLAEAGIDTQASISPILPCDPEIFAQQVNEIAGRAVLDPIIAPLGACNSKSPNQEIKDRLGAKTREMFFEIVLTDEWNQFFSSDFYHQTIRAFRQVMGDSRVFEKKTGFSFGLRRLLDGTQKLKSRNLFRSLEAVEKIERNAIAPAL